MDGLGAWQNCYDNDSIFTKKSGVLVKAGCLKLNDVNHYRRTYAGRLLCICGKPMGFPENNPQTMDLRIFAWFLSPLVSFAQGNHMEKMSSKSAGPKDTAE